MKTRSGTQNQVGILFTILVWASVCSPLHLHADDNTFASIQRGLYLVRAGDCAACHTIDESKPYAGNWALPTPFGTIYTSNLTPDPETGIGNWTSDDFYRAMHEGIGSRGKRLYPAFPYTNYTQVTRADSDAMYAYLQTLEPVRNVVREPDIPFPLNWRFLMVGWNLLNFDEGHFKPDPDHTDKWNRGKYLVDSLGHCGLCHSPKTFIGAEKKGEERYTGGLAEGWLAPSLDRSLRDGLGNWSAEDLKLYLRDGRNARSAAFGPMAKVITESTQYLTDSDLDAMVTYLRALPAGDDSLQPAQLDTKTRELGKLVYDTQCSACHGPEGEGVAYQFGAIAGSSLTQAEDPTTVVRLILEGVQSVPTESHPTPHAMPAYDWALGDAPLAAVVSYIRNAFGNAAPVVSASDVADIRRHTH